MRQRILLALCVAAGGAAIACAQAQPVPDGARAGRDGPPRAMRAPLTRTDAEKKVAEHFAAMDLNRDGAVTRDEMAAAERTRRDRMHALFEARLKEHRERAFDRLDANHDGSISRGEFAAAGPLPPPPPGAEPVGVPLPPPAPDARAAHDVVMRAPDDHGPMMIMHGMAMRGSMMGERWFERADANRDNKVTLAEAKAVALARFDRLDANRDGTIQPGERRMAFRGGAWRDRRGAPLPPPSAIQPSRG